MLTKVKGKTRLLLVLLGLHGVVLAQEKPRSIVVAGWPLETKKLDEAVLSQDALMGPLVCPALTRLNLNSLRSETFLLKSLRFDAQRWVFELKSDLKWWDDTPVSVEDLKAFVEEELPLAVRNKGLGQWTFPEFTLAHEGQALTLTWKGPLTPAFGPYILNELPFRKKTPGQGLGFQCAGSLRPQLKAGELHLTSAGELPALAIRREVADTRPDNKVDEAYLNFRFGEELHPSSHKRQVDEALHCEQALDTPLLTLIAWNPKGPWTSDANFRRAMTHLLPRGALLRAGAGSLGDLVSGPILRLHPGYKKNLLVPPYDMEKAQQILNKLGYGRSEVDGYRRTAKHEIMELKFLVHDFEGSTLLRKVIDDSLRAIGIKTNFTDKPSEGVDAVLASVRSSWPDSNLSSFLHSQSPESPWPWRYQDPAMDKALELYGLSLTQERPDFTLLEKVHEVVYKLEPFSLLMQHRMCLEAQLGKGTQVKRASAKNPDWFGDLIRLSQRAEPI